MLLTVLVILLVIVLFVAALLLIRTAAFARPEAPVEPSEITPVDSSAAAEHLAEAVRCQTFVAEDGTTNVHALTELHALLKRRYPLIHATLKRETVADYSLLYTWPGSDPSLPPMLFMGHLDVVPADPATLSKWTQPPFDGVIADDFIWGRGTLDIKGQVIGLMETVEALLSKKYKPIRTLYLAFGHDEERGGLGAKAIVELLQERGVQLGMVLDEGGMVVQGSVPGVNGPVAMVGTAEKGVLTLEMTVNATPGHSSMPDAHTAIGVLAAALVRLENNPLPSRLTYITPMFRGIAASLPFFQQMVFANLWLFGGIVRARMLASPQTAAMLRTTTAVTVIQGGVRENVLPSQAKAYVNFRLTPDDTIASVCQFVRETIHDERVIFAPMEGNAWEASPVSPHDDLVFERLSQSIRQVFGNLAVAPYLVLGATDARQYVGLCQHVYRFTPALVQSTDLERMHGIDERLPVAALGQMVRFYETLIRTWDQAE